MNKKTACHPTASRRDTAPPEAVFSTRPAVAVTCPHCWTEQRAGRSFCYGCGARFRFAGEEGAAG